MDASAWIAGAAVVVAVIAAGVAVWQAAEARRAVGEARRQSDASERSAAAAERANELAQAAMEPKVIRWRWTHFDGDTWRLTNTGTAAAFDVALDFRHQIASQRPARADQIDPDDHLDALIDLRAPDGTGTIVWTWRDALGKVWSKGEALPPKR